MLWLVGISTFNFFILWDKYLILIWGTLCVDCVCIFVCTLSSLIKLYFLNTHLRVKIKKSNSLVFLEKKY